MKIALAQMEVVPGDPERNVKKMLQMIEDARNQNVDIIIFPEMCVGGYMLGDQWLDPEVCKDLMSYNDIILKNSSNIVVIFGNIYYDEDNFNKNGNYHPNKDGRVRKYNAAYVFQNAKKIERKGYPGSFPSYIQPKTLLPNYRMFDDERYFFSLKDIALDWAIPLEEFFIPYTINIGDKKIKVGIEICEDLWFKDYRKDMKPINPSRYLINNGAEYLINISCSPWTYQKNSARDRRVFEITHDINQNSNKDMKPLLYVNNVGAQNNGKNIITFDGGTTIYNKNGTPVLFDTPFKEELIIVNDNIFQEMGINREEQPKIAQKNKAIICGLRYFRHILGWKNHPKFIIGLSGGIDSAIVSALVVQALGKENVMGVNLPTRYNSDKTKQSAKKITRALDIPYLVIPIENITDLITKTIEIYNFPEDKKKLSTLHKENIQAKIRGTSILSNLAAKYGGFFTNNGNKIEIALGYATLYGDVGGALAPIGDLTKVETYEMAKYINKEVFNKEIIPLELLPDEIYRFSKGKIPPSAELKDNQIDPMKFGYHDALLDAFMHFNRIGPETVAQWYLDGNLAMNLGISEKLIERWQINDPTLFIEDLEWFTRLFYQSVFKRVQAPPIIITSRSAFGFDFRESQIPWNPTKKYLELKEKILPSR